MSRRMVGWVSLGLLAVGCSAADGSSGRGQPGTGGASGGLAVAGASGSGTAADGSFDNGNGTTAVPNPQQAGAGGTAGIVLNPDETNCGGMSYEADPQPVDIYIVMDASGSMFVPVVGAWYVVAQAVKTFVGSPQMQGVGVALNLYNNECSVDVNAMPMVSMAELPGNAAMVGTTLDTYLVPIGMLDSYTTNTAPALRGGVQHQIAWQAAHPERKAVVLLVTDGFPTNECGSLDVEGAAAEGLASGIQTFVLGLGNTFGLDAVAVAGGTGAAVVAEVSGQGVLDKLDEIRGRAFASCTLNFNDENVPEEPEALRLFVTDSNNDMTYEVLRDRSGGGWSLSADARTANLEGTLCDEALKGRLKNLTFVIPCPDAEPVPPLPVIIPD